VVVRVVDPLLSAATGDQFDIFMFGHATNCHPIPRSMEDLMEEYPLGATVTIMGSESVLDVGGSHRGIITIVGDWASPARVPGVIPRRANGLLDFPEFSKLYEKHPGTTFSLEIARRNAHREWFEDYEYLRA